MHVADFGNYLAFELPESVRHDFPGQGECDSVGSTRNYSQPDREEKDSFAAKIKCEEHGDRGFGILFDDSFSIFAGGFDIRLFPDAIQQELDGRRQLAWPVGDN